MNPNELFAQYRNKPSEYTLTKVLKASQNLIYGIIVKVAHHEHDSEDLTQEVLIKVIQNINILPKETNFGGWLNRTSLNTAINYFHQRQRIKTLAPKIQELKKDLNTEIDEETIGIIYQHLAQLECTEESLILNKFIHQMTYAQMSSLYQLPKSTIESKINNILQRLKGSIEKAGFAGVSFALASTLEQLKAAEVTLDLLPKVQSHYPASYPKVKPDFFSSKFLLKVFVPVVAILIAYFTIDHLNSSNQTFEKPTAEFAKLEKSLQAKVGEKVIAETNNMKQPNAQNKTTDLVSNIEVIETIKKTNLLPIPNEEPKVTQENDFAGQLIDAETKKPIADAKLEIWDIYTYEKFETTTDAEGKYFIPKGLDTTFFFYLKFIKEGYATKQTFQHFLIHSKLKVQINKGKKISQVITFDKPANTMLYRYGYCNLEIENHLSLNQKYYLEQFLDNENIPAEFFTLEVIKIENVDRYLLNVSVENENNDAWFKRLRCPNADYNSDSPSDSSSFFQIILLKIKVNSTKN